MLAMLGLLVGWVIITAICAVPCFIFVATPIGRRYAMPLKRRLVMAFLLAGIWSGLIVTDTGSSEDECYESTPQGSGRC